MDRIRRWFSFNGRMARLAYWQTQLLLSVVFAVALFTVIGVAMSSGGASRAVGVSLALLMLAPIGVMALANGVRRLHDRDKSGWWLLVFWIAPSALADATKPFESDPNLAILVLGLSVASLGLSIWGLLEVGLRKGTRGPNRFGDDPMQPAAEVFA